MTAFLIRRAVGLVVTLWLATVVVFLVLQVLPGDPAALMLDTSARPDTIAALRHQMGLDRSAWVRYVEWVWGLVRGDFGVSYTYAVPVSELIAQRVMVSVPLAVLSICISTAIAIPVGVLAAARRGRGTDAAIMGVAQFGVALPNFWLGILLILLFAVAYPVFPAGGFVGWEKGFWPALRCLILPALSLALPQAAILSRVTRSAVLETLGQDYVRTALAKGLSGVVALWRHAVPNALIPVVTIIGLQFSFLLAGTVIIENVFALPGMGRWVCQAISQRDLSVVQDLVVVLAGSVIVVNFLVDLAYLGLDPRISHEGTK